MQPCPICMCQLLEQSGYDEGEGGSAGGSVKAAPVPYAPPVDLCKLRKCGHMMHRPCLLMMLKSESAKVGLTEGERGRDEGGRRGELSLMCQFDKNFHCIPII